MKNFLVRIKVDGKKNIVMTGPRGKKGGIHLEVMVEQDGGNYEPIAVIIGKVVNKDFLELCVYRAEKPLGYPKFVHTCSRVE